MFGGITLVLATLFAPLTPAAGTAVRLTIPELAARSDLCLQGRVTAARAILEPGRRVDTEYTIAVDRTWWGEPQASRAIRIPGGVLPDGSGMLIPGLPRLATGEEVILFLSKPDPSGMRMPIGLAQGRLTVATDRDGTKHLVRDLHGLATAPPADGRTALDYAAAVAEIEAALAARRARGGK